MQKRQNRVNSLLSAGLKSGLLAGLLLASACGKGDDLPNDVGGSLKSGLTSSLSNSGKSDDEILAAIPKILEGLDDIKQELKSLRMTGISAGTGSKPSTTKPGTKPTTTKPGTKPTTGTSKPSSGSSTGSSSGSTSKPATADGTAELKKVLGDLASKPFAQASIEKTEKHLVEGRTTTGKLIMYTKQPNLVKIDAIYSSAGGSGAKVVYTSGVGTKVKIRPGGAMSFVSTELDKTDDRVDSTNRYTLDQLDLFGLVSRLNNGYTATLVGKTTVAGAELHILKVVTTGTNTLDKRISHEYIGYEPSSYKLRLWETYTADSQDPYMRVLITKIDYPANIPDSTFKP